MDRRTSVRRYYEPKPDYDMGNMPSGRQDHPPQPPPMPLGSYGSGPTSPVYPSLPSAPQNAGNRPVRQFSRSASVNNGPQDYQPPAQNYGQNHPPAGQNYGQNYPPIGQNYGQSNYPPQSQNYNQQSNNYHAQQPQYPKLQEYTPRNYPPPPAPAPIVAPPRPNNPQQQFPPRPAPAPIVIQPGALAYNPAPLKPNPTAYGVPGVTTSGLEYLASLDGLTIRQRKEMVEIFTGCETANRYRILDSYNREIFYAKEHSNFCARYYCGRLRSFDMSLTDELQQEVVQFVRPFACDTCLCPCWMQTMEVQTPPGYTVAKVEEKWSIWLPKYKVKDASGETIYYIEGPCTPCCTISCCCNDVDFVIYDKNKRVEMGVIKKKWSGCLKECFTDADNFTIKFPVDANAHMKATLLGVAMLIDYNYFEK